MKKRMDNKGFSLVELIIVIAIMAILIGIVGSQVIPYIEKSRISKDKDVVDTCYTAIQAAVAKEGVPNIEGKKLSELNGVMSGIGDEVMASIGNGIKDDKSLKDKFGSNAYKGGDVYFWFDAADGFIGVSVNGTGDKAKALIISSLKTYEEDGKNKVKTSLKDVKAQCGATASSGSDD